MTSLSTRLGWQKPQMRGQSALPLNSSKHRQLTQSFLQRVKQPFRSNTPCYILQIPQEILDEIIKYIPLLYKAYLATSCRSLYNRIGTVLRDPNFQHAYPSYNNQPFIRKREVEAKIRTKLVRTVGENASWKFCLHCEKLHPRTKWRKPHKKECYEQLYAGLPSCLNCKIKAQPRSDQVGNYRYYRDIHFVTSMTPLEKVECLPWAGVVEICLCLKMTYQHRDQMKHLLEFAGRSANTYKEFSLKNCFFRPSVGGRYVNLYHECTVKDHLFVTAEIRTKFYVENDYLMIQSNYHVRVPGNNLPVDVKPSVNHSQRQLRRWTFRFAQFLDDPSSRDNGWLRDWRLLGARLKKRSKTDYFHLQLDRNLGKGRWPDTNWKQCRVPRSGGGRWSA